MNTIPSIFNEKIVSHAVLGGIEDTVDFHIPVTCIILCRNSRHFRTRAIKNVLSKGFEKVISVEMNENSFSTYDLVQQFPTVKFIVVQEKVNQGEMLNIAMSKVKTEYAFVIQEDLAQEKFDFTPAQAEKYASMNAFCICPKLQDSQGIPYPVKFFPAINKSMFTFMDDINVHKPCYTLYSADLAGFYNVKRFVSTGGFDYTITSGYWQKVDLFLRAWLWGEKVYLLPNFSMIYSGDFPEEDRTVDISYLRFYLKNLLPKFAVDHARINLSSYVAFKFRNSCGFVESMRQFKDARNWVFKNRYRFTTDALTLLDNWKMEL